MGQRAGRRTRLVTRRERKKHAGHSSAGELGELANPAAPTGRSACGGVRVPGRRDRPRGETSVCRTRPGSSAARSQSRSERQVWGTSLRRNGSEEDSERQNDRAARRCQLGERRFDRLSWVGRSALPACRCQLGTSTSSPWDPGHRTPGAGGLLCS